MDYTVYILLTHSGTWFSRLIHLVTSDPYTHVSIGLDGPSGCFYSFARKNEHFALPAGLVEEQANRGLFSRRPDIPCCLYALPVSEPVYLRLRSRIDAMFSQKDLFRYNLLGVVSCCFRLPFPRRHHFFCSQFVAALLEECGALKLPYSPSLTRPSDFSRMDHLTVIHCGPVCTLA